VKIQVWVMSSDDNLREKEEQKRDRKPRERESEENIMKEIAPKIT
jgi:hypothetical protein